MTIPESFKLPENELDELGKLITQYHEARGALRARLQQIEDRWQGDWHYRSDTWHDSKIGKEAQSRIDQIHRWITTLSAKSAISTGPMK